MSTVAVGSVDPCIPQLQLCCCFCARNVVLPSFARPAQFIICTICERKMLAANAAEPAPRLEPSSGSPSGTVSPAQLTGQPQSEPKPTIVIKARPPAPPAPVHPPLVIKLPPAAASVKGTSMDSGKQRPALTVKVPPKRRPSQQTRMPLSKVSSRSELPLLLARWAETEKAIAALSDKPHFNDKGEYLFHHPLTPSAPRKTISASPSAMSPLPSSSNSADTLPSRQVALPSGLDQPAKPLSPVVETPAPSVTSPGFAKPTTPVDIQSPYSATRPRLTLRLPGRSSLSKQSTLGQPLPSASRTSEVVPSPSARPCRTLTCTAVLHPSHPWIFCSNCLQNPAPKAISPVDDPRGMGQISQSRRISEPRVSLVEPSLKPNDPPRRKSEPMAAPLEHRDNTRIQLPQLLKSSEGASKTRTPEKAKKPGLDAHCALPTPPPSSRQSSPTAPPEASDPPSSPEMPLAALSSPHAPRYKATDEVDDTLWDSDLSDLTPLESSGDENTDDEDNTQAARGRAAVPASGKQSFTCVRSKCHNLLIPWTQWKMCHSCRVKLRERSRERNTVKFARASTGGEADASGAQRVCALRTCKNTLPAASLYRWKLCERCRARTRRQSRKRKYGDLGLASDEDGEVPLALGQRRRSSNVSFKKLKLTFKGETVASVEARKKEPPSVFVVDNAIRYLQYQSSQILFEALRDRLLGFINATTQYMLFKVATNAPPDTIKPTVFAFEGEFSVIADPAGGEVGSKLQVLQGEIGKVLGIPFVLSGYQVEPTGAIVGQYSCIHDILVPLPISPPETPVLALAAESATDSSLSAQPPVVPLDGPLHALLNIPYDDTTDAKESFAAETSENSLLATEARKSMNLSDVKPEVTEPVVKPERPTIPESNTLNDSTERLTMTFVDVTPVKASPEDVVTNFDVVVKRMAGELKVSILWDRSHKYFPGLRTVVQFRLVG